MNPALLPGSFSAREYRRPFPNTYYQQQSVSSPAHSHGNKGASRSESPRRTYRIPAIAGIVPMSAASAVREGWDTLFSPIPRSSRYANGRNSLISSETRAGAPAREPDSGYGKQARHGFGCPGKREKRLVGARAGSWYVPGRRGSAVRGACGRS